MNRTKLLVVDDEKNIVELIRMNLTRSGFEIIPCYNGLDAIEITLTQNPDLILLDLMLPDIDGLEVCRRIRLDERIHQTPIIMLTAKSEETDKVIGLGLGADDYITKPFGLRELEARVRTVLRRVMDSKSTTAETATDTNIIQVQDITIDVNRHIVKKQDEIIEFTLSEFKILKKLAESLEHVLSRSLLLEEVTGEKSTPDLRIVDVHIRNIRKKLSDHNDSPKYIETIRGVGYKMK
ncbi:two component transcriptional regulator, winged helix family [Alkaliphilus metalliredigens QYMF]|uniref:Stage 0 sporulation protein A homolog n=1 Tax=Alkaliphilus metalliredigens (strain QYMF) TaxID=293826 RepID=A6TSQ9_ALKMQ|nr:response regulator transcription factor [Alkaliphilus metalliredigens]ABR49227.1 two component transcriptional regulator, winged helix family [Alkaliphilus metalliredigens QYMF]